MKKSNNKLRVFHTLVGTVLVGQETGRENGIIKVEGISTVEMHQSNATVNFTPLPYVTPGEEYDLRVGSLLGETQMPTMIQRPFLDYLEDLKKK